MVVLTKKACRISMEEIGEKIERTTKAKGIDVDKLMDEAIEWVRKSK